MLDQLLRVGVGMLELTDHGFYLPVDELTHDRNDRGFLLGEPVHAMPFHPVTSSLLAIITVNGTYSEMPFWHISMLSGDG
jgi:hypothetical protein